MEFVGTGARKPGTDPDETELILVPALGAKSKREAHRAPKGLPALLELAEVTSATSSEHQGSGMFIFRNC